MGKASPAIVALNAGELSPQMEGRIDAEQKYPLGCHIQQNFIPLKQGPAQFRSGSVFVQSAKNASSRAWLRRFEFSQTQAFIIEFGDLYVRFYTLHGPLLATGIAAWSAATAYVLGNLALSGGIIYYCILANTNQAPPNATYWYPMSQYQGSPTTAIYEIPSPYHVADLTDPVGEFTLQFDQSADVLYIAAGLANGGVGLGQGGYPPYTLTRYANSPPNWQFAQYAPIDGPFSDVPQANVTPGSGSAIALGVSAVQGPAITITAYGGNVFASTDVGRLVRIASGIFNVTPWATGIAFSAGQQCSNNGNNYTALTSATTGGSPPVHTAGAVVDGPTGVTWLYTDSGYGVAQITAYTDAQHVTATVLTRFPANVVAVVASPVSAISQANPCVVSAANGFIAGVPVFLFGVAGMTQVNQAVPGYVNQTGNAATVTLAGIDSTGFSAYTSGGTIVANASTEWQLGAWSATTEWPHAVAFFKDRLFWAGDLHVWASVAGLYTSHAPDSFGVQTTDSAINVIVAGADASGINWLSSAILLLIGTQGGEYALDSANYSTSPLGPANVEILRQSQWRSRAIRPELIGTTVLYVQRAGRKLFAMDYTLWLNRYDSTDQSKYAYHITVGGITALALQQEPYALVWALRADGTLLSYTFNREDNVTAWARHNIGGNGIVESIATIPSPDGLRDELWMIVNRTVNGAVTRTVEYLAKPFEGPQAGQAGDAQASAWYVDCGVQYNAPASLPISGVTVTYGGGFGHYNTNLTYLVNNSFTVGQQVSVSGIQYTGNLNPNGVFTITAAVSSTSFTISFPGLFSFAYVSGGGVSPGNQPSQGSTTISGIPPVLWNQTVNILADGGKQTPQAVSGTGTLTLSGTFNTVTLGFPYQGNLVPMRFEGGADIGTAQGKLKQGANLVLRLVDALGGAVAQLSNIDPQSQVYVDPLGRSFLPANSAAPGQAPTGFNFEPIRYNETTTGLDTPPPIQSGDFPVSFPHAPSSEQDARDFYVLLQQNDPYPLTVVGLFPSYTVAEPQ